MIKISDINVAFSPNKIPFPNSLQIDYLKVFSGSSVLLYLSLEAEEVNGTNFIQGGFFNWPSPENVSRLAPPKFAWTGPPP